MKLFVATVLAAAGVGVASRPVLTPLGVCTITEGTVGCWDVEGKLLPELATEVQRRLNDSPFVGFYPGQKTRYLITRQDPQVSVQDYQTTGRTSCYLWPKKGSDTLIAIRMVAAPSSKTGRASLKMFVSTEPSAEMPLRKGAEVTVDGVKITLGAPMLAPFSPWSSSTQPWRFGVDRTETNPPSRLSFVALDRKGNPINYVDNSGKPVDAAKAEADFQKMRDGKWDWRVQPNVNVVTFQDGGIFPNQQGPWIWFNVDPKSVSKMRVKRVVERNESFEDFPLDPVQSKTP